LNVERQDLDLWSPIAVLLTTAVNAALVVAALIFFFTGLHALLGIATFISILDYVGIVAAVPVAPGLFRNAILERWIREKDFDFIYSVQVRASLLFRISMLVSLVCLAVSLALRPAHPVSSAEAYAMVGFGAAIVPYRLADLFRNILRETSLGVLCLRSYSDGAKRDARSANRKYLMKGLSVFERSLRNYGVHVPHEKLAFVFNITLLKGVILDKDLDNFVASMRNPTPENLSAAVSSSQDLLSFSKGYTDRGLQIPHPFWRRFAAPRIIEFYGNIVYFAILLTAAILTLLGVRIS